MKGKKTGGRQKGTPNKTTSTLRDWFLQLINDNRAQIEKDLREMEAKDRLQWIERILPYVLPKVQNPVEVEGAVYSRENINYSNRDFDKNYKVVTWADRTGEEKHAQELAEFKAIRQHEDDQRNTVLSYIDANASEPFGFPEHATGAPTAVEECGYNCTECKDRRKCKALKLLNEVREIPDCDKSVEWCDKCNRTADCRFFEIMINEMADDESESNT